MRILIQLSLVSQSMICASPQPSDFAQAAYSAGFPRLHRFIHRRHDRECNQIERKSQKQTNCNHNKKYWEC